MQIRILLNNPQKCVLRIDERVHVIVYCFVLFPISYVPAC